MKPRPGCYYCFKTLDPRYISEDFRIFAKCTKCGTLYHESCLNQNKKCLHCGDTKTQRVEIEPPRPLYAITKPTMLPIKASAIVYSVVGKEFVVPEFVYKHVLPLFRLIYRKALFLGGKIFYDYIIPVYYKHILPAFRRFRNRGQD